MRYLSWNSRIFVKSWLWNFFNSFVGGNFGSMRDNFWSRGRNSVRLVAAEEISACKKEKKIGDWTLVGAEGNTWNISVEIFCFFFTRWLIISWVLELHWMPLLKLLCFRLWKKNAEKQWPDFYVVGSRQVKFRGSLRNFVCNSPWNFVGGTAAFISNSCSRNIWKQLSIPLQLSEAFCW